MCRATDCMNDVMIRTDRFMDEMVTTPEAAKYLDVCAPHIRLLLYRGDLEGRKIGRDLWITKASLIAYKKNRRPVGRPPGARNRKPMASRSTSPSAAGKKMVTGKRV